MKKPSFITHRDLLISLPIALVICGALSAIPIPDPATYGMTGIAKTIFGVPFPFIVKTDHVVPGGGTETEFYLFGLLANLVITYLAVLTVTTLIHARKSRHSQKKL